MCIYKANSLVKTFSRYQASTDLSQWINSWLTEIRSTGEFHLAAGVQCSQQHHSSRCRPVNVPKFFQTWRTKESETRKKKKKINPQISLLCLCFQTSNLSHAFILFACSADNSLTCFWGNGWNRGGTSWTFLLTGPLQSTWKDCGEKYCLLYMLMLAQWLFSPEGLQHLHGSGKD